MLDADVRELIEEQTGDIVARQAGIQFKDEGSALGDVGGVTSLDFVGAGVTAARVANAVTVTIPGGGGGPGSVVSDTIWDAKGDLAAGTGADASARLPVGANNTFLVPDSTLSTGLKWIAAAAVKTLLALVKGDVGLGSVDNTSDSSKPVSTAQAAADAAVQAFAIQRANHTGTQSADTLTDGSTNKAFLATERTKLSGIATGATANDTDANLKARANHTGTQLAATISDFNSAALAAAPAETGASIATLINDAGSATPNDTDLVATAEGLVLKRITWTNIKAFLKTYFDTLYPSGSGTVSGTNTGDNAVNTLYSGLAASKADLASPTFTGNPLAPTPAAGDNDTSIATTAFVQGAVPNSSYRSLLDCSGSHIAARVAGTYWLGQSQPAGITGTGTLYPPNIIYIDSADYPTFDGKAPKLRIRAQLYVNDVAPTGNYTFGLYPVTRPGTSGGAGLCIYTMGTVVSGSTVAVNAPAADSMNILAGSDFALPANGHYVIGFVSTANVAASSHLHMSAILQMRNA